MIRIALLKLAYLGALLAVVATTMPFVTPDMPWWAGIALVAGMLALYGVVRIVDDFKADLNRKPRSRPRGYRHPLKAATRVLRR
jgi:hypothetical protein